MIIVIHQTIMIILSFLLFLRWLYIHKFVRNNTEKFHVLISKFLPIDNILQNYGAVSWLMLKLIQSRYISTITRSPRFAHSQPPTLPSHSLLHLSLWQLSVLSFWNCIISKWCVNVVKQYLTLGIYFHSSWSSGNSSDCHMHLFLFD